MTRGTIHFIAEKGVVHRTTQFNGDMYLTHHGANVVEALLEIWTLGQFKEFVEKFNEGNFRYEGGGELFQERFTDQDLREMKCGAEITDPTYADYTYWKNATDDEVIFQDKSGSVVILAAGEVAIFKFCSRYGKFYK